MFPTVPENEPTRPADTPHNVPSERPVDDTADAPRTPEDRSESRSDTFTVPKPAPPKPRPEERVVEPATDETFTHYVHLADGRVLKADLSNLTEDIGGRYYENRGEDNESSTHIIGVYTR